MFVHEYCYWFNTVKEFQLVQSNIISIQQSNGSKYNYVIPTIQFGYRVKKFQVLLFNSNNYLQHYSFICPVKWFQVLWCITNSSLRQSFIYTQLIAKRVLFLTIPFCMSFVYIQFKCRSSIWPIDQSGPGSNGNELDTSHSPKLQDWSLTIKLFSVICRTLVGVGWILLLYRDVVGVFYSPSWQGSEMLKLSKKVQGNWYLNGGF